MLVLMSKSRNSEGDRSATVYQHVSVLALLLRKKRKRKSYEGHRQVLESDFGCCMCVRLCVFTFVSKTHSQQTVL